MAGLLDPPGAGFSASHTADAVVVQGCDVRVQGRVVPPVHEGTVPTHNPLLCTASVMPVLKGAYSPA
jgi:hypothetical protein